MSPTADVSRYLENWKTEREAVTLYEKLAAAESNPDLTAVYRKMADTERRHVAAWEGKLIAADAEGGALMEKPVKDFHDASLKGCDECADFAAEDSGSRRPAASRALRSRPSGGGSPGIARCTSPTARPTGTSSPPSSAGRAPTRTTS